MQTPYAHVVNVSWQRQLPVGIRAGSGLSRHASDGASCSRSIWRSRWIWSIPSQGRIISRPPAQLSKDGYAGATTVAPIPYFENMFPDAAGGGVSATQNIYNTLWKYSLGNETGALYALDILCYPGMRRQDRPLLADAVCQHVQLGFHRRAATTTAASWCCATPCSHGFQMELSYTYAKSLDMGSDDERTVYSSEHRQQRGQQLQRDPERLESAA